MSCGGNNAWIFVSQFHGWIVRIFSRTPTHRHQEWIIIIKSGTRGGHTIHALPLVKLLSIVQVTKRLSLREETRRRSLIYSLNLQLICMQKKRRRRGYWFPVLPCGSGGVKIWSIFQHQMRLWMTKNGNRSSQGGCLFISLLFLMKYLGSDSP